MLRGELCSGCGLCAGVSAGAITMGTVEPGYARPVQHASVNRAVEERIAIACPGAVVAPWSPGDETSPYWGPAISIATGHASDPGVRHASSSGGALSALAIHALESGAVEAVLHIAADPARPTRNVIQWSRSRTEVLDAAGSRYAASSPLADIDAVLGRGERFLFIGKPCDVSALRQLARVDPRVDRLVPLMLSFFCGGIPSHAGADRIVRTMGLDPAELAGFRYRGNGWPGRARAETRDGHVAEMSYAESWGGHLSKEVQFRCKICPDAVGGVADIAAADAWYGGESGYPQFDERDGRSLIIGRTPIGQTMLDSAAAAGAIETTQLAIAEIDLMQPSQARRKRLVAARLAACAVTGQPRPVIAGLAVSRAAVRAGWGAQLRNFLGTVRRIMIGRR